MEPPGLPPRQPAPSSRPESDPTDLTPGSATVEPFEVANAPKMRGAGWEGDLAEMRGGRGDIGKSTRPR